MCCSTKREYTKSKVASAQGEVGPRVVNEATDAGSRVVGCRQRDHLLRHVDAGRLLKVFAEREGQSSDTAAKIERPTLRNPNALVPQPLEDVRDLLGSGAQELFSVTKAARRPVVDSAA